MSGEKEWIGAELCLWPVTNLGGAELEVIAASEQCRIICAKKGEARALVVELKGQWFNVEALDLCDQIRRALWKAGY